ncbi:hypothetical protein GDO86_004798 [Hymenochirus boettgeri]|uniref:G-protein coupled receptors family 3 profile domain-containing protein n=1 Tax=Hymenochirus boettgeri TaxID=247094 RepID=A0A8T2K6H7_9PIPI|nr:hypothetical protein GDO86_004798 [Hymenochirus boettgeri]
MCALSRCDDIKRVAIRKFWEGGTPEAIKQEDESGNFEAIKISYGATDTLFSDRLRYPSVYQTVPNEKHQNQAIIQLLKHFGWTWVGILSLDDDSSQRASENLKDLIIRNGMCVEFVYLYKLDQYKENDYVRNLISKASAKVVIVTTCGRSFYIEFGNLPELPMGKTWILTSASIHDDKFPIIPNLEMLNGSLIFSLIRHSIAGIKEYMAEKMQAMYSSDHNIVNKKSLLFECYSRQTIEDEQNQRQQWDLCIEKSDQIESRRFTCSGNETLPLQPHHDLPEYKMMYSIYKAVYALAYGLHGLLLEDTSHKSHTDNNQLKWNLNTRKLNDILKKIHFSLSAENDIFFTPDGDVPAQYDIINMIEFSYGNLIEICFNKIGSFKYSGPDSSQLFINKSLIKWNRYFTDTPRSVCSESCSPGYRKAPRNVQFTCCYDCVLCSEGHISNTTDMETCIQCHEDQWPNDNRTVCIQRTVEFLSYEDPLAQSLAALSLISSLNATLVLLLFIKQHKTPVVKANNQTLSYILLLSLTLSFLCCFLFIGHPEEVTCLLRQVTFGINFTISVSCVLAKSVTVVIAFNATKPGSKIKKWVGIRVSICLVLLCTLVQVVICLVWLISSPPFPDYDTHTYPGKMILQCNEGSVPLFYTVIGYMGFLSALSFIVAFLVRKLPASFNEAQLITFSMLVFCSVWVSFIPAYLSTKGKYMVAVEIFAILASSAGLLGCIFIPKCYIILFHPEHNTRKHIAGKI